MESKMPLESETLRLEELLIRLEGYVDRVCLGTDSKVDDDTCLEKLEGSSLPARITKVVDRLKEQKGTVSRINRKLIEAFNHILSGNDGEEFADG